MDDAPTPRPLLTTPPLPIQPTGSAVSRRVWWLRLLLFFGGVFISGLAFGLVLVNAGIDLQKVLPKEWPTLGSILLWFVAMWFAVLWHELGHALAGWLVDWRLLAIAVVPLMLRQTRTGLQLERHLQIRERPGFVSAIPRDDRHLRRRNFVFIAGGPAASLLLLVLAVAGYRTFYGAAGLLPGILFNATLWGLLLLFIANLVPHLDAGSASDGRLMLQLLQGGPRVEQRTAIHSMGMALIGGVRPRDLPDTLFARAMAAVEPIDAAFAHSLAYWRALDRGDVIAAAAYIDVALALRAAVPPSVRAAFAAEAAFLTARHDPAPDAPANAEAWLQLAKPRGSVEANYRRAQAAVHLAQGRAHDAQVAVDDALRLLDRSIDAGSSAAERELLLSLGQATGAAEGAA